MRNAVQTVAAIGMFGLAWGGASAEVRVAGVFGDHMVLQQSTNTPVWGWAAPGERVTVSASWGADASATAGEDGTWRVSLRTPRGGSTPHTVRVRGENEFTLDDVLIGEVWLCSGQSNMEWDLRITEGGEDAASKADRPLIRLFDIPNTFGVSPADDVDASWRVCDPEQAAVFSAVGFYFGTRLQDELDVPIGLIESDWGGTVAEAWTSAEGLDPLNDFDTQLAALEQMGSGVDASRSAYEAAMEAWYERAPESDPGSMASPAWSSASYNAAEWAEARVPGAWEGDLASFDGFGWYRRSFEIPASAAGKEATLDLGPIDDCDTVWINGTLVGETMQGGMYNRPRSYTVPRGVLKSGANTIAVRVLDTGGGGGFFDAQQPVRLRAAGGEAVDLSGIWAFRRGAAMHELPARPTTRVSQNSPTVLFNEMIAPIAGYGMRGAIWYQGESNVGRAAQYRRLLAAMIGDWRERWEIGDFPFGVVQIAPYNYGNDGTAPAELREAQLLVSGDVPNVGLAVTMDIGNPRDIHPRKKREVGDRLARWALAEAYGHEIAYRGPTYRSMKIEGDAVRLRFDHADGLHAANDEALSCFTVAGRDGRFVPAEAEIDGETVVVRADGVNEPTAVRFAWGTADGPALLNSAGLPTSSFRTDGPR